MLWSLFAECCCWYLEGFKKCLNEFRGEIKHMALPDPITPALVLDVSKSWWGQSTPGMYSNVFALLLPSLWIFIYLFIFYFNCLLRTAPSFVPVHHCCSAV